MANNIQRINVPEEAVKAIRSKSAPTAKQAERAKQASRAITLDEVKQLRRQNPKQVDTFLSNYNDPTELNSFIDALTNREAVSKKFGDTWGAISTTSGAVSVLSFAGSIIAQALATFVPVTAPVTAPLAAGLKVASRITAIPSIPAALDVAYNKGIKPIAAGKSQEALLNTLMNLGETADYITNPIKGGILEGSEGFIKGTGLSDAGRVNYDFDTGFFLTDMLLEAVVDPLNWVDFGTSKLLKQNIKPLADNATKPIVTALSKSDLAGKLTTQSLDNISNKLSKTITQVTQNYQTKMLDKKLTKAAKQRLLKDSQTTIQQSLVSALKKELPEMSASQLTDMLALANKSAAKDAALNATMKEISNISFDKLSTDTIKSLEVLQDYSNSYQKFMTKNAFMTSGYGLGVEAARNGWKGINAWANNLTINRLTKASIFDYSKGLDITQYQKAKNIWEASSQYVLEQTSEVSQRDINAFYNFMNQQLNRDRQAIMHIMQDSSSPLKKSARIAAVIQELNPKIKDLNEYIDYIKQINDAENGIYKQYIDYFTNVQSLLESDAFTKPINSKLITTADKLWQGRTLATMQATQDKVVDKVTKAISKDPEKLIKETDKQFALKLNNEFVTTTFLFDPVISMTLDQIVSDEGIGALLNKVSQDINALAPEVAASIANAPTIIKQTGINFRNLREFYSDLAMTPLQEIVKVQPDDFKRYILDQIFNHDGKTVTELLAEFDSITMPALKNGLETMLSDVGFTFKDYPVLEDQIAGVYKRFLQLQQASGIDYINATITPQFTQSIDDLIKYMPDYAEQLQVLSAANKQIKLLFGTVENVNLQLLNSVFTDTDTIFNTAKISTRQLSDAGLALSTVSKTDNLKYFNISQNISGSALREINNLGESINRMKSAFDQYSVYFKDAKRNIGITKAYNAMRKLLRNENYAAQLGPNAFYYLKETEDVTEKFIQLSEFAKLNKDKTLQKIFKRDVLQANLESTMDYLNILNPSRLLVTDFAWDPMAQAAHFSEIKLNKNILESIKQYENLSLGSKKITNDFQAVKDLLSANKADRPKMLQQERYVKAASALNNYLEYFQEKYASLFDKNMATESLENIRNIFLNFPELNKKYGELVDTLEKYWNGEISFQQPAKYEIAGEDEYTVFYNNIKMMNQDIQKTILEYSNKTHEQFKILLNKRLTEAYEQLRTDFKKQYKISEMIAPDMYEINKRGSNQFISSNMLIPDSTIRTQQGDIPVHIWERRHTTEMPYSNTEYYKDIADLQKIIDTDYNTKYEYYTTYTHEYYKDLEYAQSRMQYRQDYEDTAKIINELKYRALTKENTTVDKLKALKEIILEKAATPLGSDPEEVYIMDPEAYARYEPIFENIFNKYNTELKEAIEYANDYWAWQPKYKQLRAQFYKQFSSHDQKLLWQIENAKSEKQAVYFTHTLPFSADFKKMMKVQLPKTEVSTFRQRYNLRREFTKLMNQARGEKFNKDLLNKITEEFRKELGERNKTILKQRFTPIREKIYKQTLEDFNFFDYKYKDITPYEPFVKQQQLNKLINRATDANAKGAIYNLFSLTPEQFKNELAYRMRFVTMHEDDVADPQLKAIMNKFNKGNTKVTSTQFVDVYKSTNGWYSVHDKSNHRYWYLLDPKDTLEMSGRQAYLNGNPVVRLQKPRNFNEFAVVDDFINDSTNPGTVKTLNELSNTLETLTGTALGDSQGDTLTQNFLEQLYAQMPKEVQDLLPKLEVWTDQSNFQYCRYNESILGTMSSKNKLGTYSSNMIINARNAIQQAQCYLKPKNEYVNSVFDSMLSISSPNSIYSRFSDNDLLEALQANPEYKLVVTAYHKKYGLQVREILPTSVKAIQKAKQLGGWVIPLQTYKDVYAVLNHRLGSEGFAKLWSRIMYTYKFGYLCRPGAMLRNFIDTNLKSKLELGDEFSSYKKQAHEILDDVDALKAYVKGTEAELLENAQREYGDLAFRLFEEKDRIEKFIQRRSKDGYIREDTIKEWFANNNAKYLTYEAYQELNSDFLSQGISGNIMADLYTTDGGDAWNTFTQLTGNIIEAGNKTENYNRLAVYLYELDRGNDYTTALSKIAKTHFDYSFKSKAEQLADLVFPFTTFTMRNFSYWIEQLEKHPWIMRNYAHLMKPFWSFKDFTPQELATNKRLQTQILYGQLPLAEFNNKVLTFKLNPSIQDAIQMFSDPINNIYDKLAAPIAQPIAKAKGEYTNISNMLPVIGPAIQSAKTMINTGTPIPSLIGVQPAPKRTGKAIKFTNSNLSGIDKYTDNTYRTPKYRKNIVYDSYATKGVKRYRLNLYPIVDIAHDIKMRYSINVYNRIKNRVQTDVYNGIRYRIRLDANRFR